ncbi:SURF1 family protein [Labrenzia aggregata]|uniref:SURF1-like protein n=2 Tax=Roseibium aggregatum TaxID=187304 RepID=A0A926S4Z6_9HYPH|nr:SURF1 family protein [Roseibium aggregatum]MBD1544912.1 SURF1 family protein [Roseibium aggregatum]
MLVLAAVFTALGIWQVQRLFWKLDLIARVESRVHAAPVPAPAEVEWPAVTAKDGEYRHVTASGTYLDTETLVQAVTEYGPGFWVMTPLKRDDGTTILVNRGFVPTHKKAPADRSHPSGPVQVTGLLRKSQPGGAFLRSNDPAAGRWYSRDVEAIAKTDGLIKVAPYFIDAQAGPSDGSLPIGGLTVIKFRNSHLAYAMTWGALALMSLVGFVYGLRAAKR